ncbi:REP element-mobilizing transposase RayT [Spirosoma lacussanchae]|uniref:IS200/IS605 family transposase n=1 Tax=Spirosoma lacussanchae TaxID=1884249 RepID=UPI00110845C6|nr:IS200/IS605 family transposase [Spirosoma lacussanchae]
MSYVRIWVHAVWSTKNREPFFQTPTLRQIVFSHIRDHAHEHNIYIDFINGYTDHVHVLISLRSTQSIAEVVHILKGESSRWLKEKRYVPAYFAWQTEYFAVSVCESTLNKTRDYIRNQEAHHEGRSYTEEYDGLLRQWGFTADD